MKTSRGDQLLWRKMLGLLATVINSETSNISLIDVIFILIKTKPKQSKKRILQILIASTICYPSKHSKSVTHYETRIRFSRSTQCRQINFI